MFVATGEYIEREASGSRLREVDEFGINGVFS